MFKLLGKVIGVLLTLLLWYLQELPQKTDTWYDTFITENKIKVAICAVWLVIASIVLDYLIDYISKATNLIGKIFHINYLMIILL